MMTTQQQPFAAPGAVESVLARIQRRAATVGTIGMGCPGPQLALLFEQKRFAIRGFDVDIEKVRKVHGGESYIRHVGTERVGAASRRGRMEATGDFDRLSEGAAVLIPTSVGEHHEPDRKSVPVTVEEVAKRMRPGQVIVLDPGC